MHGALADAFFDARVDIPQALPMHTEKRRVLEMLGFVFALGACEGTELPSDHGDSEVAHDSDQVTDNGFASPDLAEPHPPSVDPADYPTVPELSLGAEKPCSFGPDFPNRCELAVEGAGFLPIDQIGDATSFVRNTLVDWYGPVGLITSRGEALLGYRAGPDGELHQALAPIPTPWMLPPRATSQVEVRLNLDPRDPIFAGGFDINDPSGTASHVTTATVHDSLGNAHQIDIYFTMLSPGEWSWAAVVTEDDVFGNGSAWPVIIVAGGLGFDGQGRLAAEHGGTANVAFFGAEPQELTIRFGDTISEGEWSEGSSQFTSQSETFMVWTDGYSSSFASVLDVTWDGWLCVTYGNGQIQCPGRLAVALFETPADLYEHSTGVWVETPQAGRAALGPALFEGRGGIAGARLPPPQ